MSNAIAREIREVVTACRQRNVVIDVTATARLFAARYPSFSDAELVQIVMEQVVACRANASWGANAGV